MQRIVSILVVFGIVVAACSGAESDTPTRSPADGEPDALSVDLTDFVPATDEETALRLEAMLEEAFIAELATNGVTLDPADLALFVDQAIAEWTKDLPTVQSAVEGVLEGNPSNGEAGSASGGITLGLARPTQGSSFSLLATSTKPQMKAQASAEVDFVFTFISLLVTKLGLDHRGPGDYGPSPVTVSGGATIEVEKRGTRLTARFRSNSSDKVPNSSGGSNVINLRVEITVSVEACPDEAGSSAMELDVKFGLTTDIPGTGAVISDMHLTGSGTGTVDDNAEVADVSLDVRATQVKHTSTSTGQSPPAHVDLGLGVGWSGGDVATATASPPELKGASDSATQQDADSLAKSATDYAMQLALLVYAKAEEGWSNGQCIELEIEMPSSVGIGSETTAKVKVNHRYEERVLQLPVTGEVTVGGESIDPAEATGDPAKFTYTAPAKANETATLTFEVRSKRGADKKTVDVTTESMAVDVAFSGTISYSMTGFSLNGVVTIPSVTLLEYGGDDPELKGKWTGQGPVEISLTSQIEGCGTATGTQEGGRVTVVGTPHEEDGTVMLSLLAEDMEGGEATLSCGTGSAIVAGGGISIGAGLINLGKVIIPAEPGTYPFESSGVAAGMVQYEVKGEALVTESEDFPG